MSNKKDLEKAKKLKDACLESFKLPENFEEKVKNLEYELEKTKFSHEKLIELLELYSKAAQHYDSANKHEELVHYLDKLKQLGSNDKTKEYLGRRKSKEIVNAIKLNIDDKKDQIDKIRALIKQSEKFNKQDTCNIIENYSLKKNSTQDILNKEIHDQSELFKKRMEQKKIQKMNSLPSFNNKSKSSFKSNPLNENVLTENKETTPKRKKSILRTQTLDQPLMQLNKKNSLVKSNSKENFLTYNKKKSLINCDTPIIANDSIESSQKSEKISSGGKNNIPIPTAISSKKIGMMKKKLDLNLEDINKGHGNQTKALKTMKNKVPIDEEFEELFDEDFHKSIDINFDLLWDKAQKHLEEKLFLIEEKIVVLIDDLSKEKSRKILEINEKYDKEMKEIEPDIDLDDEGNINTIVYNQLKDDKEIELKKSNEYFYDKRKEGMKTLLEESRNIISENEKNIDIEGLKNEFITNIKEKIIQNLAPKLNFSKKFDFTRVSLKNYATTINNKNSMTSTEFTHSLENDNIEHIEENRDKVEMENIPLKPKKVSSMNKPIWKPTNSNTRRISSGFLGKQDDNKD